MVALSLLLVALSQTPQAAPLIDVSAGPYQDMHSSGVHGQLGVVWTDVALLGIITAPVVQFDGGLVDNVLLSTAGQDWEGDMRRDLERSVLTLLVDYDFGARRMTPGWTGSVHAYGGASLAWLEEHRYQLTDNWSTRDRAKRSNLSPGATLGLGLLILKDGRYGLRLQELLDVRRQALLAAYEPEARTVRTLAGQWNTMLGVSVAF
jgi:hypothetical protein